MHNKWPVRKPSPGHSFGEVLEEFKGKMQDHRGKKGAEVGEFNFVVDRSKAETDRQGKALIKAFEKKKKRTIEAANGTHPPF
jgi:hypothetical protein